MNALEEALALVKANGYVVLKEKSYRQAQERHRVAQALLETEKRFAESTRNWARDCLYNERRITERLTFVWGVAKAHGATDDELAADPITREPIYR